MMDQNFAVGNLVMLGSLTVAEDLECCDCADPDTGSENCLCEDF